MAKETAKLSRDHREGHGDPTQKGESVKKGTYYQVGTSAPLSDSPISINKKTGGFNSFQTGG